MIPWTVWPAPWLAPSGEDDDSAAGDGQEPPRRVELLLGHWHGVPVWVEGRLRRNGQLVVERLITTDPELYLWPALHPGAILPPG